MNLGEKILELRTKENMSQSDLADILNVSRQSVSKWETNSSVPELEKLLGMSKIFKVSLDELVSKERKVNSDESNDNVSINQKPQLQLRKIIGLVLLGIGSVIFILILFMGDYSSALVLSSPFLITGLISLFVSKYTILWNGWILYGMIYLYLRFATGIRISWIFHKWLYRADLRINAIIAWIMAIGFGVLIIGTYKAMKRSKI